MGEQIININGVLYVARENEHGIYMQRVNADGSDYVEQPRYTDAEVAAGISIGPDKAPTKVVVAPARKRGWLKRLFGG